MIAVVGVLGALGLAIGSFLNVVIYRVPNGLSVVAPASACPGCETPIKGRDNVPLLSWLLLGGRCRSCRMRISARYPAIELVTGLAFIGVALVFTPAVVTAATIGQALASAAVLAALLYFAAISVALTMIDVDVHRLPNAIVYPAYPVMAVLVTAAALAGGDAGRLVPALIGAAGSLLFYFILAFAYPGGMGLGDVKLAGVIGMLLGFLGWPQLAVGIASAFALGGVFGIVLIALRRGGRKTGIPFGPWMLLGAWIGIFAGEPLAQAYLTLVGIR
ncbi:A24 family peptidase [Schumannella luteola]|uniref:Leader peptidase (Prepilin peptidase)/N-methyltransferase n=1 Tax=Schumannella luteola TaxID=472059 RepID=A0A852YHQ8_9MICO|nr:A24 family peptidase [Schumannella luteola]NYH00672.1 leader peptidase (prepilin peptidase)/N-methyltransferase [Schumannella luteola]TPX04496.1 prepilin peptidase [Schumannella luteola]